MPTLSAETKEPFKCERCQGRGSVVVGRYTTLEYLDRCPTCRGHGFLRPFQRSPRRRSGRLG